MMGVGIHRDVIKTVHYYKDLRMGNSITSLEKKLKTHLLLPHQTSLAHKRY